MKPIIQEFPKTKIIGLSGRFISSRSPQTTSHRVIPKLWETFMARVQEIPSRTNESLYGVVLCLDERDRESSPDEMHYTAGAAVKVGTRCPAGMTTLTIPAGTYAVFTHKGPVDKIAETMNLIYGSWLEESGRTLRTAPHLEIYGPRFKPGNPSSEIEIGVPVE